MNRCVKKFVVSVLALSLAIPAVAAPEAQAAAKPKLKKSISVAVKGKKTLKVTGVKVKKIKSTKWSIKGKKLVKLSKPKKNSVVITGKKAGSTKVAAKIKIKGVKKPVTKTCTVTVTDNSAKKSEAPSVSKAPADTSKAPADESKAPANTPVPTLRPLKQVETVNIPKVDPETFPDSIADQPLPAQTPCYVEDFEKVDVGTKTTDNMNEADVTGINGWFLRGYDSKDEEMKNDYLEVVKDEDGTIVGPYLKYNPETKRFGEPLEDEKVNKTKMLKCHRTFKTWQGPLKYLTDILDSGCEYKYEADVYSTGANAQASWQLEVVDDGSGPGYGQFPTSDERILLEKGKWCHLEFNITIPDDKINYALYFETFHNQSDVGDLYIDNVKLTKTKAPSQDKTIPSLKETYKDVFDVLGVGAGLDSFLGENGSNFIASQYASYTAGNEMKPDALMGRDGTLITLAQAKEEGYYIPEKYETYEENKATWKVKDDDTGETTNYTNELAVPKIDFSNTDKIIAQCHKKGMKLRGHTLNWHQQTPVHFFKKAFNKRQSAENVSVEVMNARQELFVKTVMNHILKKDLELAGGDKSKCVLHSYDAVNEYLHGDGIKPSEPTYWDKIYGTKPKVKEGVNTNMTLRPSYVKDTFRWAHETLVENGRTDVKLVYNDFNTYDCKEDVVHLVDFINEDGKICDGIGMQSHLTVDNAPSANTYATALEFFRVNLPEGVEIMITELDAMAGSVTDKQQAAYYDQIFNALITSRKKGAPITTVIIWSLYDAVSWRSNAKPCIFSGLYAPKSAFYAINGAKERYWK